MADGCAPQLEHGQQQTLNKPNNRTTILHVSEWNDLREPKPGIRFDNYYRLYSLFPFEKFTVAFLLSGRTTGARTDNKA